MIYFIERNDILKISKNKLNIEDMLTLSKDLWEENKDKWAPMEPAYGKNFILYMIEEIGEAISIIKKKGEEEIMKNDQVRAMFVEELADIMMYFSDVLNRYEISGEEFTKAYIKKHEKNMGRNYVEEYQKIYS